jgi:hypothetical protein
MDVTFRESKPFYGEPTDLSLFAELHKIHSLKDGHEGEKAVFILRVILWTLTSIIMCRFRSNN